MLKEKINKGIVTLIVAVSLLFIFYAGVFMSSMVLSAYPIAIYLLVMAMWWQGNKDAKNALRFMYIILSIALAFLLLFPDGYGLDRLETFKHRFFDYYHPILFVVAIFFVFLATIGLFIVKPNNHYNPSNKLIKVNAGMIISSIWIFTVLLMIEQSFFLARHNVGQENLYVWIKENNLFWLHDFMYGGMNYMLKSIALLFEISLFSFTLFILLYTKFDETIVFRSNALTAIVLNSVALIFISVFNNKILGYVLEIGVLTLYFLLWNSLYIHTDNLLMNKQKFYSHYSNRRILVYWYIAIVALKVLDLIYFITPLSYGNWDVTLKIVFLIFFAMSTTFFMNQMIKKINYYSSP